MLGLRKRRLRNFLVKLFSLLIILRLVDQRHLLRLSRSLSLHIQIAILRDRVLLHVVQSLAVIHLVDIVEALSPLTHVFADAYPAKLVRLHHHKIAWLRRGYSFETLTLLYQLLVELLQFYYLLLVFKQSLVCFVDVEVKLLVKFDGLLNALVVHLILTF